MEVVYIRPDRGDSDRTRLLKEVLRSTQNVVRGTGVVGSSSSWKGPSDTRAERPKDADKAGLKGSVPGEPTRHSRALDALHLFSHHGPHGPHASTPAMGELHGAELDLAPVLRACDYRIGGLCARLQTCQVRLSARRVPERHDGDSDGITIVDRPEASSSMTRLRTERAAAEYISQHARWRELEELEAAIDKSAGYDDLRKVVPRRFRHHPTLSLLSDITMQDTGAFRTTIWNAVPAQEDITPKGRHPSSLRTQKTTCSSLGGEVDEFPHIVAAPCKSNGFRARVRISRDHSAPCLN